MSPDGRRVSHVVVEELRLESKPLASPLLCSEAR